MNTFFEVVAFSLAWLLLLCFATWRIVEHYLSRIEKRLNKTVEKLDDLIKLIDHEHFMDAFKKGAKWDREQMLKKAIPFYQILKAVPPGPQRETTRVIIIKED